MKTVGFIDYYLDEWHANNYLELIKSHSDGEFEVGYAYGKIDNPKGGMTNEQWAEKYNITLCKTIEEVISKSDLLIVLSPDNPEMHEELCDLPLKSGKLVYIDKTFSPDKETAQRIFEKADKFGAKCYSSSALRFATEFSDMDDFEIDEIHTEGAGTLSDYAIHQIEPVVMLMNTPAKRVIFTGTDVHPSAIIEFEDGRHWHMMIRNNKGWTYRYSLLNKNNGAMEFEIKSDYFGNFIDSLIEFFKTGIVPVPHNNTVDVMAIRNALMKASQKPFRWIEI